MVKRIEKLTDAQRKRFDEWSDKWIEIGLRTGPADRQKFESAAKRCYEFAGIPWHGRVVWVSSPIVMAIAAPVAALMLQAHGKQSRGAVSGAVRDAGGGAVHDAVGVAVRRDVHGAVDGAVRGAVDGAVGVAVDDAVRGAVRGAVGDAVGGAVSGAVGVAVHGAVDGAVRGAVSGAVHGAVRGAVGVAVGGAVDGAVGGAVRGAVGVAVRDAVRDAVRGAVRGAVGVAVGGAVDGAVGSKQVATIRKVVFKAISKNWANYIGGQLWGGGWWWGGAYTSFFREVCKLELSGDLWKRGRAYEETIESACWWYPHRDFLMVCERPTHIRRELTNPNLSRGWDSHRLHNTSGPAVVWPDGWGVYAIHGVRVPGWIIDTPERITVANIENEQNAEVRRVMLERYGVERFLLDSGVEVLQQDDYGLLYRKELAGDEPLIMVRVLNPTPEPDGTLTESEARAAFGDAVVNANLSTMQRIGFASRGVTPKFKQYFLRVPPTIGTAREAVAWTFDKPASKYSPETQT